MKSLQKECLLKDITRYYRARYMSVVKKKKFTFETTLFLRQPASATGKSFSRELCNNFLSPHKRFIFCYFFFLRLKVSRE